jgi:PAS domain S-box-containing protein
MKAKRGKELKRGNPRNRKNLFHCIWEENRETILSSILEQTHEGIAFSDLKGNLIFVNQAFATMHGYTPKELIGKHLSIFHTKDQLPSVRAANKELLKTGKFKGEIMHVRKDGTIFPTLMHNSLLKDKEDRPVGMIGTLKDITELRDTYQRLDQSYQLLKMTFESILDAIFIVDTGTRKIIDCNRAATKIFGYSQKDMLGRTTEFLHVNENHLKEFRKQLDNAIDKQGFLSLSEFVMKRSSGEIFPTEHKVMQIKNDQGKRIAWVSIVRDKADLKNMEVALNDKDIFLQVVFNSIQDAICVMDKELNIILTNHYPEKWYSKKMPIVGKKCYEVFHDREEPCEICPSIRTLKSGKPDFEVIPLQWEGGIHFFETYSFPFYDSKTGSVSGVIEYVRNITKRKIAEDALKESEERYRKIFNHTKEGIIATDKDGKIVTANPAAAEMLGYTETKELIGKNGIDLYAYPEQRKDVFKRLMKNSSIHNLELTFLKKDGSIAELKGSATIHLDNKGNIIQTEGIFRDISEQKKSEQELKQAEERYRRVVEDIPDLICRYKPDTTIIFVNETYAKYFGKTKEELIGRSFLELIPQESHEYVRNGIASLNKNLTTITMEHEVLTQNGQVKWQLWRDRGLFDNFGKLVEIQSIGIDITELKKAKEVIEEREKELKLKASELEEFNAALKVLLKKRDMDKTELEEKVLFNIRELVMPFLKKLQKSNIQKEQKIFIDIIESYLDEILSSFSMRLTSKFLQLTPKEITIANLIKQGRQTRDIARLMNTTSRTIEFHRVNLRKKLGLKSKKDNLRSYLLTIHN